MTEAVRSFLQIVAAGFVLAGGYIHFVLWDDMYKDIPSGAVDGVFVVDPGFLLNAIASVVLAIGLVVLLRSQLVVAVTLVFQLASIAALVLSRQASVFGWMEEGWDTDPTRTVVVEILASVTLLAVLALYRRRATSTAST